MAYPANYRYTKQHEWIHPNSSGIAEIGITDFAQRQVGEVVFVGLPKVGDKRKAGEELATVESTKAVFEIFAPVTCEVVYVNSVLETAPEKVNADPHGEAWFARVRIVDPEELKSLMDAQAYEAFCPECKS